MFQVLFQTASVGGGPTALSEVPPTPVTYGWLAGSSTAALVEWLPLVQSLTP